MEQKTIINEVGLDKYTRLARDLEVLANKYDMDYPLVFSNGVPSMMELEPKENKVVSTNLTGTDKDQTPVECLVNVTLGKYEWEEKGKKKSCVLPVVPFLNIEDTLKLCLKMIQVGEAFRKMLMIQVMTRPEITKLNLPGTGLILADQIVNNEGISADVDAIIKAAYRSESSNINTLMQAYDKDKFEMKLKDNLLGSIEVNMTKFVEKLVEILKKNVSIEEASLKPTGVAPVISKVEAESINPIVSVGVEDNRDMVKLM